MKHKDNKLSQEELQSKHDDLEKKKTVLSLICVGLMLLTLVIAMAAEAKEPSKMQKCINMAIEDIKSRSDGKNMDKWQYMVTIKNGECVYTIINNSDGSGSLLRNQRREDYQKRKHVQF